MIRNVLFIGGPYSGKSNYLFRSWIAIEREQGRILKDGLPAELDYLNAGALELLEGRFAPHTSRDTGGSICRIPISIRERPESTSEIVIPDVSGELWTDLYDKRQWPTAWDALLEPSTGYLLFLQAGSPYEVPSLDWLTCERYFNDRSHAKPQPETPTQVVLVDWLQIVRYLLDHKIGASVTPRLSIVITAWDRVIAQRGGAPADYLASQYPMLSDFLASGNHRFNVRVFGVSVAAGELDKDPTYKEKYLSENPAKEGYSVSEISQGRMKRSDVLSPLYWALNEDS